MKSDGMTLKLFVVVVTYKGNRWYDDCFSSLRDSSYPLQVVIVDNASNDGTIEYIREKYPDFVLIESQENLGFGRANNLGIRYALNAGCDYVFLLNQDAWVETDTFEKMINIHLHHPEYGVLGCINVTKDRCHMLDGFIPTISNPKNVNPSLIDDMYFNRLKDVYEVKSILAAAWLLPRNTLEVVGGFDPIFYHYGEDDNYLQRAKFHGIKVGVCPNCRIVHDAQTNRVPEALEFRNKEYAQKREWLLKWCDVNNPKSDRAHYFELLLKSIKQFVQMDMKKAGLYRREFVFCMRNRKAIKNSLSNNRKKGPIYL